MHKRARNPPVGPTHYLSTGARQGYPLINTRISYGIPTEINNVPITYVIYVKYDYLTHTRTDTLLKRGRVKRKTNLTQLKQMAFIKHLLPPNNLESTMTGDACDYLRTPN